MELLLHSPTYLHVVPTDKFTFVALFLLGDSPAYKFYVQTFRHTLFRLSRWCKQEEHKIQTLGYRPKERIQNFEHRDSLK